MTEPALKLIETNVTEKHIHMRYADHSDPARAATWIDFQVPLSELTRPQHEEPLGDAETRRLAEVRLAALRYVRELVGAENRALVDRLDRMS